MAASKKNDFNKNDIYLSEIAKALSHPARVKILKLLTEMDQCMVGRMVDNLPLAQATVSQHLSELKKAGLIQGEIDGPRVCYCVNKKTLLEVKKAFDSLFLNIGCC